MKQKLALRILNCAAGFVLLGGCFDMLLPAVPSNLLSYMGIVDSNPQANAALLILGLLRALGGCLLAIGITALALINGPLKRGERWASWTLLLMIGLAEGINASQMWRFGSPYYFPLFFVAMTVAGLALLNCSEQAGKAL
jgi:hypothetical protein